MLITKRQQFILVEIERIYRRQIQCGSNGDIFSDRVKNIVRKGENAGH